MKGLLRERPLVELIREIVAERLAGALRLERTPVKAVLYFEHGELIFASSNLRQHRLAESLRRWNVLSDSQIAAARMDSSGPATDVEVSQALVANGTFSREEMARLLARQIGEVIRPALLWVDGEWAFDSRVRPAKEALLVRLETSELRMEGARRLPPEFIHARLKNAGEVLAPEAVRPGVSLLPAESFVLSRIEGPMTLSELLPRCELQTNDDARRVVYTLALGGFLRRTSWPRLLTELGATTTTTAPAGIAAASSSADGADSSTKPITNKRLTEQDERPELEELFARANKATYYQMLSVEPGATASGIKQAYYKLAKRFHPDRFHGSVSASELAEVQSAFARLAQGYETLKDEGARAAYDARITRQTGGPHASATNHVEVNHFEQHVRPGSVDHAATPETTQPAPATAATIDGQAEEIFRQGQAALEAGNYGLALRRLGEAASRAPQDARLRAHYGRALARDRRTRRQAEAEFLAAIALDARNASYRVMLAELYLDIGLHRRAAGELERALAVDPQHQAARALLDELKRGLPKSS